MEALLEAEPLVDEASRGLGELQRHAHVLLDALVTLR
jgi:hypothetical protein